VAHAGQGAEAVCVRSVTRLVDLIEDLEGGREADRMQRDAQEQYRIEGDFLLYGDPSPP
jgi:hypothetical protein